MATPFPSLLNFLTFAMRAAWRVCVAFACAPMFAVFFITTATAAPIAAAATTRPTMPLYSAAEIPSVCDAGLATVKKALAELESLPLARVSVETVFHPVNRMQIGIEDVEGPIYLLSNVSPDKAVRDAAEACLLKFNEFDTDWLQSELLYRRVQAVGLSASSPWVPTASLGISYRSAR